MIHPSLIEARLGELSFTTSRWFKAEIHELQHILMDDEKIVSLVCGRYFGSFALLVATDQRLLLIDKRVFFMNIEDTRYDMISEINYNSQVYSATVTVFTINKTHKFTSIKYKKELRELTNYVQQRVMEFRRQQNQVQAAPMLQIPQRAYRPAYAVPLSQPVLPQANGYYGDDTPVQTRHLRGQVGHVAHLVGSAATGAVHSHPLRARPLNPYVQGSLMTRHTIGSPTIEY